MRCLWEQYLKATTTGNILLFLNDIVTDIKASIKLFAYDTSLYVIVDTSQNAAVIINRDLEKNPSVVGKLACKIQSPENVDYGYF